jgi:hypothetical protein
MRSSSVVAGVRIGEQWRLAEVWPVVNDVVRFQGVHLPLEYLSVRVEWVRWDWSGFVLWSPPSCFPAAR